MKKCAIILIILAVIDLSMNDKLILASSSPRRIELLTECKIPFEVVNHEFDEDSIKIKNPVRLVEELSRGKAESIAIKKEYYKKSVLGVDTIVVYQKRILGKPKSKKEAEEFIRLLSNKTHRVISGIALVNKEKSINIVKHSISFVKFAKISKEFIKYYLDNNLWEGYAGGYAIQESFFNLVVEKIKGSYSNIVGLPVNVLYNMLKDTNFITSY